MCSIFCFNGWWSHWLIQQRASSHLFRIVDEGLQCHEDVVGLYQVESIKSDSIVEDVKDTMLRLNLPISDCWGQCYDGAANIRCFVLHHASQKMYAPTYQWVVCCCLSKRAIYHCSYNGKCPHLLRPTVQDLSHSASRSATEQFHIYQGAETLRKAQNTELKGKKCCEGGNQMCRLTIIAWIIVNSSVD